MKIIPIYNYMKFKLFHAINFNLIFCYTYHYYIPKFIDLYDSRKRWAGFIEKMDYRFMEKQVANNKVVRVTINM